LLNNIIFKKMSDSETENHDENFPPMYDFKNAILNAKKDLYYSIIFGPKLGTPESQDVNLIGIYMDKLSKLYLLALDAKKGIIPQDLNMFPLKSQHSIMNALYTISNTFKNKGDNVQQDDYISNCYKNYQFLLNDKFD